MSTDTIKAYRCFTRTWWTQNPSWPNGREPGAGRRHYVPGRYTMEEARQRCREYNESHDPGPLSRKMEFEQI